MKNYLKLLLVSFTAGAMLISCFEEPSGRENPGTERRQRHPPKYATDAPASKKTGIYNSAALQRQPEFPGGIQEFYKLVNNNFRIPDISHEVTARIYVSFVIEKDGSMTNIKVLRDPGYGLGREAVRVLESIKTKWEPGIDNNKPVRAMYNLPITINIRD